MNSGVITILSLSASGSILALVLLMGKPLLKNRVSKAFSYYIWLLVLLRLIVPLSAPINIMETRFYSEQPSASDVLPKQTDRPMGNNTDQIVGLPAAAQHTQSGSSQEQQNTAAVHTQTPLEPQPSFDLWGFVQSNLLRLWLTGAIVSIGWFSIAYAIFSRRIRHSCTVPHSDDVAVFERLRGDRHVRLFCSSCVTTPMFIGVLCPVIVLPQRTYVRNGMGEELNHILRHELTHYRRKDVLYKWLIVAVTSLHWFNPLMILIRREVSRACELSCDEVVIRNMSADEKRFYGNMLLSLAANQKLPAGSPTTTLCEEKKALKERLMGIKNYKKKPAWTVALMLVLALLLTGCAAVLGVASGLNGVTPLRTTGNYEGQQDKAAVQASNLHALNTQNRYADGKMFEAVPVDFVNSFQDKVAALTIPDARKGESAVDIQQGSESWSDSSILFLDSIPDQNIYLYGYYDADCPDCGLILDVGQEQHIYTFPYRYMTNTALAPDLSTSSDGSKIYVSCHTGSGTGVSVSELYVFQVSSNQMEPYYVDINDLADCLSSKIAMSYDAESKKVTVYSGGRQIMTDSLTSFIGTVDSENITPGCFYCGDQISYILDGDSVRVSWVPTLYAQEQTGVQSYLENMISLKADMNFAYDNNGNIKGFDLGEAVVNVTLTAQGDFNGDGFTDYVIMESGIDEAKFTVNFGDKTVFTKSIEGSDVSWMTPSRDALMAGDFDGDGKDELVFAPEIYGSNYGGKDLYILHAEEDKLTAMPLNCVKNTAIAYQQPESLNEDYMCVGTAVIDTDDGQLLRVRRLINALEDSAWYVDVHWNGEGWQIENVSPGSAYGEEAVYQYTGNISVAGKRETCNIIVQKGQEATDNYSMELTFINADSGEKLQQLQYKFPDDFMPSTIQDGSRIVDLNYDGNDDIMLDLGVYGWARLYECFVYDSSLDAFLQVPGFEEHPFPDVLSDEGIVLFHWKDGAATYGVDKYKVEGNQLRMLGRLTKIFGQSGVRYTEETMIDGALVQIKKDVTAEKIDHFDAWHMWT